MLKETANIAREVAHTAPPVVYVAAGLFGYTRCDVTFDVGHGSMYSLNRFNSNF